MLPVPDRGRANFLQTYRSNLDIIKRRALGAREIGDFETPELLHQILKLKFYQPPENMVSWLTSS